MTFEILGKPIAKGRPRFAKRGNFVSTYTPEKTATYENLVKLMYMQAGGTMFEGEVAMKIEAFFPIPKSGINKALREKMKTEIVPYPKKSDWDNIGKIVADALNGYAYSDDAQIVDGRVTKKYSDNPRIVVTITNFIYYSI